MDRKEAAVSAGVKPAIIGELDLAGIDQAGKRSR